LGSLDIDHHQGVGAGDYGEVDTSLDDALLQLEIVCAGTGTAGSPPNGVGCATFWAGFVLLLPGR
jgi:hypothetical protein